MDGFIFVGTTFRELDENDTSVGFKIVAILFPFIIHTEKHQHFVLTGIHGADPQRKTMKIGTPRNSSHPQYLNPRCRQHENINFVPCWTPTRSRKLVLQNLYVVNKEVQIFMS